MNCYRTHSSDYEMKASRSKDFSIASILGDRIGSSPPICTNFPRRIEIKKSSTNLKEETECQCNCELGVETVYSRCCVRPQEQVNERFEKPSQDVQCYLGQSGYSGKSNECHLGDMVSQNNSKCLSTWHKVEKFSPIVAVVQETTSNVSKRSNDEKAVKEKQKMKDAMSSSINVSSIITPEKMCQNIIGRSPDCITSESGSCLPNLKADSRNPDQELKISEESTERKLSLSPTEKLDWLEYTRYRPPKIPRKVVIGRHKRRRPSVYPRIPFSSGQLEFLEEKFRTNVYLTKNEVTEIATSLRLPHSRVKIWFQNRRARARREKQSLHEPS